MAELQTFLFTDIVGSVELKRAMPGSSDSERDQAYIATILSPHRARIERELVERGGRVVSTAGDGHFLVFPDTIQAARWAIAIQQSHRDEPIRTPAGRSVAVRASIHIGIPQIDPGDPNNFVGKPVDYTARLNDYATGGQILVSRSVVAVLEDAGMDGVTFHSHGRRNLKGIGEVDVYELVYEATGPRKMRPQPRETLSRQWTVLPATIGLTDFHAGGSSGSTGNFPGTTIAPRKLGNYALTERLGGGGMGDVYKATHVQFGRPRAVKVIKSHFVESGHREVIRRFYQEIKAVGTLEHPNIVVAIDSSTPSDSVHYLVMEYIDGVGADELVAQHGPLTVPDACEIARQAARGLAFIHQHGMVHRDIKPSNLMLTVVPGDTLGSDTGGSAEPAGRRPIVKILDLGLALLVGDDQQRLTVFDDRAMGTAMYMSPEQWKTTSVDIRADVYSLGCALYHLLAGKPPFWDSDLRPEKAHEREALPPISGRPAVPAAVWQIVEKMTAKRPDDRYADPADVVAALAPWAEGHRLVELFDEVTQPASSMLTENIARTDTLAAGTGRSDTLAGHTPVDWALPKSFPPARRRAVWRTLSTVLFVAAIGAVSWLVYQAMQHRESVEETRQVRQYNLQLAANFATSEILKEINLRFDILENLAKDPELQRMMLAVDESPQDESRWIPLENKLGAAKADYDPLAASDSWFINDVRGVQVARSPRSDTSRGESYAYRDYFHGQGSDLKPDTEGLKPIQARHLSAVYRSTTTKRLKVAFSVPIENGRSGAARKFIGVLAMSVDLGEFDVLDQDLQAGQEVVLLDLRESAIDGPPRRGLILHRQAPEAFRRGEKPPFIGSQLLARIDATIAEHTTKNQGSIMLTNYRDDSLTDDLLYWGALKRVIDRRPDGEVFDTQWLVLVQEPVAR